MKKLKVLELDGASYTLEALIDQGGAGQVWRARSSADGQLYALKRISKGGGSSSRHERFRNEIAFGMAATHDNVVKIHAQSEEADFFNYTMDLYSTNLREIISQQPDSETLLDYLLQLCDGLAYVHGSSQMRV